MAARQWGNAGAFELLAWTVNSNGYPMGDLATPDSPVNGTTYHAYRARSFVGMTMPTPTRSLATFFGGQRFLGQIDLGVTDFGTGELTLSKFEEAFVEMIADTNLDEATVTDWAMISPNENNPNLPTIGLMGSTKVRLDTGALSWVHVILPNVQIRPAPVGISTSDGQNPNNLVYGLVPTLATRLHTGHLFSATTMNVFNNEAVSYVVRYNSRFQMSTHVKDATMAASGASFTLGYRPTSSATGTPNCFRDNGATETPSSVSTTTGAVVIAAGGAAGDIINATCPTTFTAI